MHLHQNNNTQRGGSWKSPGMACSGFFARIPNASSVENQHLPPTAFTTSFGEDFIYQRNPSWDVPYTFSGKEKDAETGYSYFGARYYSIDLSIWLSVDPLASRYPGISGYSYVFLNPIRLTDAYGLEPGDPDKTSFKQVESDRKFRTKFIFYKRSGENGYIYAPEGTKKRDIKKAIRNNEFSNLDIISYDKSGNIIRNESYDLRGNVLNDNENNPIDLPVTEIISKGYSQAYYEHKKAGDTYYSHKEVQEMIAERPSLWPSIGVGIVAILLNKYVGGAVSGVALDMLARQDEFNQGLVDMAKNYRNEKDGIFIEYKTSVSTHLCTEVINFYSAKTGELLGTSRMHYGI